MPCDLATTGGLDGAGAALGHLTIDGLLFMGGTWEQGAFTGQYRFAKSHDAETRLVLAINLIAPVELFRRLAPALERAAVPRLLVVGALSALDHRATPEVANTAAKFGLRGALQALRLSFPRIGFTLLHPGNVATDEVLADIREGRFPPQQAIPMSDWLAVVQLALSLSPASVVTELSLEQMCL